MADTDVTRCSQQELRIVPCRKCVRPKVRRVGSKAAVLVVVWTYLVCVSCASLVTFGETNNLHVFHAREANIGLSVAALLGPVAGLVASVYFCRYKVVYASLWLMWSGTIAVVITVVIRLQFLETVTRFIVYAGELVGVAVYSFGFIAFAVNSIPFGLDQMPDASSEQITAFIHWYVWSAMAGIATTQLPYAVNLCAHIPYTSTLQSLLSATLLSLALCSLLLLHRWLIIEPENQNPLKTIFKVLKFAARHKVPVRRSAFTYWEPGIPARIDLGKSKYGGPFTNEEVEDVKTCLRMLVVLCSISITLFSVVASVSTFQNHFLVMLKYRGTQCDHKLLQLMIISILFVTFSLPVHDVIIRPIVGKCRPSTLKRAGLAQILIICSGFITLAVSVVWYETQSPDHCLLVSSEGLPSLPGGYKWSSLSHTLIVLFAIYLFSFTTAVLEFVCAQAPYNLRGLLVGMVISLVSLSTFLSSIVRVAWRKGYERNESSGSTCGIWFYLFTTITAVLGCVIWCVVAKWYKKREREEVDMCRIFAENYYDH